MLKEKFSHRNGESQPPSTGHDGFYWIEGEALIRENSYPWKRGQRIKFHQERPEEQMPVSISNGLIDMGMDNFIPVEWVTGKSKFYGPVILVPPWRES